MKEIQTEQFLSWNSLVKNSFSFSPHSHQDISSLHVPAKWLVLWRCGSSTECFAARKVAQAGGSKTCGFVTPSYSKTTFESPTCWWQSCLEQRKLLWLEIWTSKLEQNVFSKFIVERQSLNVPFSDFNTEIGLTNYIGSKLITWIKTMTFILNKFSEVCCKCTQLKWIAS